MGELTSVEAVYPGATNVPDVTLDMGYDANGNRTSLDATVDGNNDFQDTFTPDALNRIETIVQQASSGEGTDNAVAEKQIDLTYRADGLFDTISRNQFVSGVEMLVAEGTYGHDDAGELASIDYTKPASTLPSYSWTYDGAMQVNTSTSADGTVTYGYDPTGQIETADYSTGFTGSPDNESYNFGANGNPADATMNTGGVASGANQVLDDGTWTYSYDANGDLKTKTADTTPTDPNAVAEVDYSYDFRNELTGVEEKNCNGDDLAVLDYVFDMYDELIGRSSTVNSYDSGTGALATSTPTAQNFVVDPSAVDEVLIAFDGTGKITDRYLWGPAVDQILADESYSTPSAAPTTAGSILWPLTDNQGSVRDVVQYNSGDNTTAGVEHIIYNSFGAKLSDTFTTATQFTYGYAGTFTNTVTADQLHGVRWLDPSTRRWLTQDPTGLLFGGNPYEDVNNSPTNGIDPSGLCPADVPDGTNPGMTRPSLPGGTLTLTEDQLAYTRLATAAYEARRREFLRNGGHTIGPAVDVGGGSVLWAYTGGLALNTVGNMSSEFDHGVKSIANGDAGRALGNRAVAIVENQSGPCLHRHGGPVGKRRLAGGHGDVRHQRHGRGDRRERHGDESAAFGERPRRPLCRGLEFLRRPGLDGRRHGLEILPEGDSHAAGRPVGPRPFSSDSRAGARFSQHGLGESCSRRFSG